MRHLAFATAVLLVFAGAARADTLLLHFDGPAQTFADSSGNAIGITPNGDVTQTSAQSKFGGKSAYFDGTGDFLRFAASTGFDLMGDFTVDFWMRPEAQTGSTNKYVFQFGGVSVQGWEILNYNQKIQFWKDQPGETQVAGSTSTIANDVWTHVAVARASGTLRIFINGTIEATATDATSLLSNDTPNQIGTYAAGNDLYDFRGYLDEVRILNGTAAWTSNFSAPTSPYGAGAEVPEPGTLALALLAAAPLARRLRSRRA